MVDGLAGESLPGVANIGVRPTVGGELRYLLEVHLFDFSGDIYGRHADVEFRLKLRDEQKFDSFDALKLQIQRDSLAARAYLGLSVSPSA
jgi:riboflavin kinase/FMN adenylyltransferase